MSRVERRKLSVERRYWALYPDPDPSVPPSRIWSVRECEIISREGRRCLVRWLPPRSLSEIRVDDVFAEREQADRALALRVLELT